MTDIYLARQPIVDDQGNLLGFELLFRSDSQNRAEVLDNSTATATVVVNAFSDLGIERVLGAHKGFINVNAELLHSDMIELLPRQQVVLEILETEIIDEPLIRRCRELKEKGFSLALDDIIELTPDKQLLLPVVDIIKLDLMYIVPAKLRGITEKLKAHRIDLLAEKVESQDQARYCSELGFSLFQGYYFARPETLSGKRIDPSKLSLLRILQLTLTDAGNEDIEKVFKESPDLTYRLMRIINSAASGLARKISTVQQGLMLLGRKPLQRWVQLLLYASGATGATGTTGGRDAQRISPLMQLAATRGKLMETAALAARPGDKDHADRAFMVGILSLLGALLGVSLNEVLAQLSVADDVRLSLIGREGALGTLLKLCEALEANDVAAAQALLRALPALDWAAIKKAELEAVGWANSLAT